MTQDITCYILLPNVIMLYNCLIRYNKQTFNNILLIKLFNFIMINNGYIFNFASDARETLLCPQCGQSTLNLKQI